MKQGAVTASNFEPKKKKKNLVAEFLKQIDLQFLVIPAIIHILRYGVSGF